MKFVISFVILQLIFGDTKAQLFSFNSPNVQSELIEGKPSRFNNFNQYKHVPTVDNGEIYSIYDRELKPYENNINGLKYSYYHTSDGFNQDKPLNNANQIPQLIYQKRYQQSSHSDNSYLSGIITKAGDAVKETADENHNAFKNSIDSLVAAGKANVNAGKNLIQSGLAFGTSFPRFGSKFLSQNHNNQKNGFNIGGFSF